MRTLILMKFEFLELLFFSILSAYNYLVRTGKAKLFFQKLMVIPSGLKTTLIKKLLTIDY